MSQVSPHLLTSAPSSSSPAPSGPAVSMERHLFYWLTQLINRRNLSLTQALAPHECSVAKWRVMNLLQQAPGASMAYLAEKTAVDRTTLTRTVDRLEQDGLLKRDVQPHNRRILSLSLTPAGKDLFSQILPLAVHQNEKALEGVSEEDLDQVIRVFKHILENLGAPASVMQAPERAGADQAQ